MDDMMYSDLPEKQKESLENLFLEFRSKLHDASISTRSMYIRNLVL